MRKLFTIKGRDALETLVKLRDELDTFNVSKASGSFDKCLQTILVWTKGYINRVFAQPAEASVPDFNLRNLREHTTPRKIVPPAPAKTGEQSDEESQTNIFSSGLSGEGV